MKISTRDVDTASPIVLPSSAPPVEPDFDVRRTVRTLWWVIASSIAAALVAFGLFVELPYYAIAPGSAPAVGSLIQIPKDLDYPPRGTFLMTTVSLQKVRPLEALHGWLDKDIDVVPQERILGPTPRKDFRRQNVQEMDDSIQRAEVVALRRLGHKVPETGEGALVMTVASKAPADGHLKPGDVISSINNKPVALASDLIAVLSTRKFGDTVRLQVKTGDAAARTEIIKLGGSTEDKSECSVDKANTGKGCLGVALGTKNHSFQLPVAVKVDSRGIGGPSAGLAFVLGIMDHLTDGELTGGKKIAVTGTIDYDGRVGDVGGVVQKTAAVRAAGADVFLVPPGEYKDAKAHAGNKLQVIKVSTLDEALQALGKLGGTI
jgi:PDZ domain-containing protein